MSSQTMHTTCPTCRVPVKREQSRPRTAYPPIRFRHTSREPVWAVSGSLPPRSHASGAGRSTALRRSYGTPSVAGAATLVVPRVCASRRCTDASQTSSAHVSLRGPPLTREWLVGGVAGARRAVAWRRVRNDGWRRRGGGAVAMPLVLQRVCVRVCLCACVCVCVCVAQRPAPTCLARHCRYRGVARGGIGAVMCHHGVV